MKRPFILLLLALGAGLAAPAALAQTVFMVQLGSFRSDQEAADHWNDLSKRFPDLFRPLTYTPAEVVLPPDGFLYHRTQAGPVPTREAADAICKRVTAAGDECYVVETAMLGSPDKATTAAATELNAPAAPIESASQGSLFDSNVEDAQIASNNVPEAAAALPVPMEPAPMQTAAPAPISALPAEPAPAAAPSRVRAEPITALPSASPAPARATAANSNNTPLSAPQPAAPFSTGPSMAKNGESPAAPASRIAAVHGAAYAAQPAAPVAAASENAIGNGANVRVAEAIPVPLTDPRLAGNRSPYDSGPRGYPGSYNRFMPYWAEIGYFDNDRQALGYWNTLRGRDPQIPGDIRLRITQPFRLSAVASRMSLRAGPFTSVAAIRRLCSLTAPERLGCRAVRDLGGSLNYSPAMRNGPQGSAHPPAAAHGMAPAASPFGGPTPPGGGFGAVAGQEGTYWVQLGSFMARSAAEDKWSELKAQYPGLLARLNDQVYLGSGGRSSFRLRVGPFSRQAEAAATCNGLKQGGTLCLVVSGQ